MNPNTIGACIRTLRLQRNLTQKQFAEKINVSDKTISKWETGRGYPDISILETVSSFFNISLVELFSGAETKNKNISCNIAKSNFYVCPVCGNIIFSTGGGTICCCGLTLQKEKVQQNDALHSAKIEISDGEDYITFSHPMTKEHFLSFVAFQTYDAVFIKKLYPEGNAEARFPRRGRGSYYVYCNQDGLFLL